VSEAKQRASDVVACLELLVDVAEQILKGQEPWAEVAVAQLTQYLVDAREVARGAPPLIKIETVGAFHFGEPVSQDGEFLGDRVEAYERLAFHFGEPVSQDGEWLGDRVEAYERLAGAYQRLADDLKARAR